MNKELKSEDYQAYLESSANHIKAIMNKVKKFESRANIAFISFFTFFNLLGISNFFSLILNNEPMLSSTTLLATIIISIMGVFKNLILKSFMNIFVYEGQYMQKIREAFYHSFNTKDEYLKVFFARFSQSYDVVRFDKSELHDFFNRIDSMKISLKDIQLFIHMDGEVQRIAKYHQESILENEKIEKINKIATKELSANSTEDAQLAKSFSFIKY